MAAVLAERGGFASVGRAMPLVAAPITAWLNNHHIQLVGEAALRQYDGFVGAAGWPGGLWSERAMSARVAELDLETGVYTRQAFEREVAFAVQVARRAAQPCSLLVVDVDEFQALRDVRGDLAADSCLEALAQRISAECSGAGPIGRMGSDTFGLLLPRWALARACALADRLRGAARADSCVMATVSVGVASLRPSEPWGNLLEAAEAACIRAKQAGGDRSVHRR